MPCQNRNITQSSCSTICVTASSDFQFLSDIDRYTSGLRLSYHGKRHGNTSDMMSRSATKTNQTVRDRDRDRDGVNEHLGAS